MRNMKFIKHHLISFEKKHNEIIFPPEALIKAARPNANIWQISAHMEPTIYWRMFSTDRCLNNVRTTLILQYSQNKRKQYRTTILNKQTSMGNDKQQIGRAGTPPHWSRSREPSWAKNQEQPEILIHSQQMCAIRQSIRYTMNFTESMIAHKYPATEGGKEQEPTNHEQ